MSLSVFGTTSIGSLEGTVTDWQHSAACRFQARSGSLTKIYWYGREYWGGSSEAYALVYSDVDGLPSTLLGTSVPVVVIPGAAWWTFTFATPIPLTDNAYYWLTVVMPSGQVAFRYVAGTAGQWASKRDEAIPPFQANFGTPLSIQAYNMSIYAEYIPLIPPPTVRLTFNSNIPVNASINGVSVPSGGYVDVPIGSQVNISVPLEVNV